MNNNFCEWWDYTFYDAHTNQVIDIFETEVIQIDNSDILQDCPS